ncbi:hypothetical protein [Cryptosporangium phraense]|uniref:DUF4386 family protein n=1 Tax=Cryptosporangium phraense TaxID=2593070 RepID=A0A545ATX8_9ACTN|nr:hypothetical protein [Cryptosporangium phraense]TQS44055.1 hypothetical protein FL583_16515 [Cryptosporangium phraense]
MERGRIVVAGVVYLALGSLGQLVQFVVTPVNSGGSVTDNVAAAAAAPGRMDAAAWLDLLILFFVPAVLVAGSFAGSRLGRIATAVTAGTTVLGIAYVLAPDAMYAAGIPGASIQAYTEAPVVAASTAVFLLGHVLGLLVLGIALWRAGQVPRWAGACLALYPFLEVAGTAAGVKAVTIVGYLLLLAAFGACARALTRVRPDRTGLVSTPDVAAVPSSGR